MFRNLTAIAGIALLSTLNVHAVEMSGGFDSIEPTDLNVPNWDTGWGAADVTGWDYVGSIAGTGGVYLGNGWVLTAAHVGEGTFILDSGPGAGTYTPTGVSYSFTSPDGTADLTLFQIKNAPSSLVLPNLSLATSDPSDFVDTSVGNKVVMVGYGDGGTTSPTGKTLFKTWGYDTVTLAKPFPDLEIQVTSGSKTYVTQDFITANGTVHNNSTTSTNNSELVSGDSGGGDFIYNSSLGEWQLAGINEATGSAVLEEFDGQWYITGSATPGATNVQTISLSAMVQLADYDSGIAEVVDAPEPSTWCFLGLGFAALGMMLRLRKRAPSPNLL